MEKMSSYATRQFRCHEPLLFMNYELWLAILVCVTVFVLCVVNPVSKRAYLTPILLSLVAYFRPNQSQYTLCTHMMCHQLSLLIQRYHSQPILITWMWPRFSPSCCPGGWCSFMAHDRWQYNVLQWLSSTVCVFSAEVKQSSLSRVSPYAVKHLSRLSNDW